MTISHIFRIALALTMALVGWKLGILLSVKATFDGIIRGTYYPFILGMLGLVIGGLVAPWVSQSLFSSYVRWLGKIPSRSLVMGIIGALVGLLAATMLAIPLSMLPGAWGIFSPTLIALLLAFLTATAFATRDRDILTVLGRTVTSKSTRRRRDIVLLDTSVIIDGRIADICETGFITQELIIPRFILEELQHIADSPETLRRNRGRRGLEILNRLRQNRSVTIRITEHDIPDAPDVDTKLIRIAQQLNCPILTNDYNLNRVAELQGIKVLNINELANAVKVMVLPGEMIRVHIIQEGREPGQGVGYLDDGTMVVVEEGRRYLDSTIDAVVTRVLQTVAGRMIFCQPAENRR